MFWKFNVETNKILRDVPCKTLNLVLQLRIHYSLSLNIHTNTTPPHSHCLRRKFGYNQILHNQEIKQKQKLFKTIYGISPYLFYPNSKFLLSITLASLLICGSCSLFTITRLGYSRKLKDIKTTHFKMPHLFNI